MGSLPGSGHKAAQARAEAAPGRGCSSQVSSCFTTAVWFHLAPYQLHIQKGLQKQEVQRRWPGPSAPLEQLWCNPDQSRSSVSPAGF